MDQLRLDHQEQSTILHEIREDQRTMRDEQQRQRYFLAEIKELEQKSDSETEKGLQMLKNKEGVSEEAIANAIVSGFNGQLKGWWDNYLSDSQKYSIFSAIKVNNQNEPIIGDDREPIPDAVNTLIFTIASHFIGDPSLWKDHFAELLSNLRCKTLSDFRWYKDTFLTRVYTREDSQQPFWKQKFLTGLPKSLGDKVRDKIRSLTPDRIIPYDELSYGQLISFIQKVALKICQDDKIERQLAREKTQNRIDLETFCEQFGLPACHPRKSKRPSNRKVFKPIPKRISEDPEKINNILIESSDNDSDPESSDDINNIQVDDIESSSDSEVRQINVLSKDQDLLFDAIEAIDNPEQKKDFLLKLKRSLQNEKKPKICKEHIVDLPYKKDFKESKIPTKARPIQMNEQLLQHCEKEIKDLLDKGLIRPSKSPWSCSAFYVNKQAEIE
ncbi:uncharacterized protein LOC107474791 [Arachis duranensis]|uniref:Uncharacterized protein LOC107474791 n=1 Tax=Arachis duranensis TaxID=130453 RepID=A0A6P4CE76_ARADU|nr:uncharacterized protein LOC107474791 [Arachis duranensis]